MTTAADREALAEAMHHGSGHSNEGPARSCGLCGTFADRIIASGLLDQVRHVHGERICDAIRIARANAGDNYPAVAAYRRAEGITRDLSPAPQDPRFDDPAHAEHIATRAEEESDA